MRRSVHRSQPLVNDIDSEERKAYIKTIIIPKHKLQLRRKIAKRSRSNTKQYTSRSPHKPTSRRNSHKTRNSPRTKPNGTPFPLQPPIPKHPRQPTNTRSEIRDNTRVGSTEIRSERRSTVKPEPTKPQENSPEDDIGRIMRFVSESFGTESTTFAEVDREC